MNDRERVPKVVVAVDPGRDKCGIAVVRDDLTVEEMEIMPTCDVIVRVHELARRYGAATIVIGDRTGSKALARQIESAAQQAHDCAGARTPESAAGAKPPGKSSEGLPIVGGVDGDCGEACRDSAIRLRAEPRQGDPLGKRPYPTANPPSRTGEAGSSAPIVLARNTRSAGRGAFPPPRGNPSATPATPHPPENGRGLASLDLEVVFVDEHLSSVEGRKRYLVAHRPRGLGRLIPLSLRTPGRPFDDYVAVVLAERFFHCAKK